MTQPEYDYVGEAERHKLLGKLKQQYEPVMRPKLCAVETVEGKLSEKIPPTFRYQWMHSGGQGGFILRDSSKEEAKAADELIKRGEIVPTFQSSAYPYPYMVRTLRLIEDIHWGFRTDGKVVMFDLASHPDIPDGVITEDEIFDRAINELKKRIELNAAGFDKQIQLSDGSVITPIIFGRERLALKARQNEYRPGSNIVA